MIAITTDASLSVISCRRLNVSVVGARTWCQTESVQLVKFSPLNPQRKVLDIRSRHKRVKEEILVSSSSRSPVLVCVADGFGRKVLWALHPQYRPRRRFYFSSILDSVSEIYLFMVAERGLLTFVGKHW